MTAKTVRFALFAEVFSALAHPKRLEMIHYLANGPQNAGELAQLTGLSKANVSQHLAILKARGLVHCDKRGAFCHYRLTSPKILECCEMIRQLILEQISLTTTYRRQLTKVSVLRRRPA